MRSLEEQVKRWQEYKKRLSGEESRYEHLVTPAHTIAQPQGWKIKREAVKGCGRLPAKGTITLSQRAYRKIETALEEMGNLEFIAYLIGTVDGHQAQVNDILVPEQEVTSASARPLAIPEHPKLIGTVHSHGKTASNFSATDDAHILANHPVGILAGKNGYRGQLRVSLPCGAELPLEAEVRVLGPKVDEGFRAELKAKVKQHLAPACPEWPPQASFWPWE